jgi:hypothetical protein
MSGLDEEQLSELECRVSELLEGSYSASVSGVR